MDSVMYIFAQKSTGTEVTTTCTEVITDGAVHAICSSQSHSLSTIDAASATESRLYSY